MFLKLLLISIVIISFLALGLGIKLFFKSRLNPQNNSCDDKQGNHTGQIGCGCQGTCMGQSIGTD